MLLINNYSTQTANAAAAATADTLVLIVYDVIGQLVFIIVDQCHSGLR